MLNPVDPIHDACDFLVPTSPHELLDIVKVNEFLHRPTNWNSWPAFLVAFASNGCGDYFAYDLRGAEVLIRYIDPGYTIEEILHADDQFVFDSFEAWYRYKVEQQSGDKS